MIFILIQYTGNSTRYWDYFSVQKFKIYFGLKNSVGYCGTHIIIFGENTRITKACTRLSSAPDNYFRNGGNCMLYFY